MPTDVLYIGLAFLEGFALIISPCILPILPIILSGSLQGSKKRPMGIIVGFVLTFAILTFFSRKLIEYTDVNLDMVRDISYGILLLLGIMMVSTYLTEKFNLLTTKLTATGASWQSANNPQGGFLSGILFGGLVGLIWTPCAGPILAAVIVQTVLQQTSLVSFLTLLAFGIGAGVPMLLIALFGRTIMNRVGFFKTHAMLFRKILGIIIIFAVAYLILNEGAIGASTNFSSNTQQNNIVDGVLNPYPAPAIEGIDAWINSNPLTLPELKGKVVLIDFWTYSCINCVRVIPYLNNWYAKYHDKGLEIIGIHSPEFQFEHDLNNVEEAVKRYGIHYPVGLDNNFRTWLNYRNSYWPAHYLINQKGYVVYQHFGEGNYDITENNIRYLLGINNAEKMADFGGSPEAANLTPETYLGFARMDRFQSNEAVRQDLVTHYSYPTSLGTDHWALQGDWLISADKITAMAKNAMIKIHFNAQKVFIVMGNKTGFPIVVKLLLDGAPIEGKSSLTVNAHTLYQAVELPEVMNKTLQLEVLVPGLEIYTFTFG